MSIGKVNSRDSFLSDNIMFLNDNVDRGSSLPNGTLVQYPANPLEVSSSLIDKYRYKAEEIKREQEPILAKQAEWEKIKKERIESFMHQQQTYWDVASVNAKKKLDQLIVDQENKIKNQESLKKSKLTALQKKKDDFFSTDNQEKIRQSGSGLFGKRNPQDEDARVKVQNQKFNETLAGEQHKIEQENAKFEDQLKTEENKVRTEVAQNLEVEQRKLQEEEKKFFEELTKEEDIFFQRTSWDTLKQVGRLLYSEERTKLIAGITQDAIKALVIGLFEEQGLLDAFWEILFNHPYQGRGLSKEAENLVERWAEACLGVSGLFSDLPEEGGSRNQARQISLLTAISIKLTGKTEKERGHGLIGNISYSGVQGALEAFVNDLENTVVEKEIGDGNVIITERRKSLIQAVAKALTGEDDVEEGLIGVVVKNTCEKISMALFGKSLEKEEGKSVLELLFGNKTVQVEQEGVYNYVVSDVKQIINKVDGIAQTIQNTVKPFGKLAKEVTTTLNGINELLGLRSPKENSNVIDAEEEDAMPPTLPFNACVGRALKGLQGMMKAAKKGFVQKVLPAGLNQLLWGVKWGAEKLSMQPEENRGEKVHDKRQELLRPLIDSINNVIQSKDATLTRISSLFSILQEFSLELENKNVWVLVNGVPLFLAKSVSDFAATPHYLLAQERAKLKKTSQVTLQESLDLNQIKKNSAHYGYLRFIYQGVAGLSPANGGVFNRMFSYGKTPEDLKRGLFEALDRAHAAGDLSKMRLWIAKKLMYFMQPICTQFLEPFLRNMENKLCTMGKQHMLEEAGGLVLEELTNYFGSVVQRFEDVAEGDLKKWGTVHTAMLEKVREDRYYNDNLSVKERHRKVIKEAIDAFAPSFTFASSAFKKLDEWGVDKAHSKNMLNPLIFCIKIIPYVLIFTFLYLPQEVMNTGLKWGLKEGAMLKSHMLDGIVQEIAKASSTDLYSERARLNGIQSVILKMIENIKNPNPLEEKKKMQRGPEEEQISDLVAHLHLAVEYGNAKTISELKQKKAEKESKEGFSLFGIKFNFKDLLDEETHQRTVEHLSHSYRQAINEDFIAEMAKGVVEMLAGMFEPQLETPEQLRKEISELKDANDHLLREAIYLHIEKGIEAQFDETGKATTERFISLISDIKTKTREFIDEVKELSEESESPSQELIDKTLEFESKMTALFAEEPNQMRGLLDTFAKSYSAYAATLSAWRDGGGDKQAVLQSLADLEIWQEEVQMPFIINYSLKMKGAMHLLKGRARTYAESLVREVETFLKRPYNVAGLTHWFLGMFGDGKFPFQKTR